MDSIMAADGSRIACLWGRLDDDSAVMPFNSRGMATELRVSQGQPLTRPLSAGRRSIYVEPRRLRAR